MSTMPAVIVRKGGFLAPLFYGLFGFLSAVVVCATLLGVYGLHIADTTTDSLFAIGGQVISGLPQWQQALPPMLAEALDDRRAPDYRGQIDVVVETVPARDKRGRALTLIEVTNNGPETVTVLALNVVLEDEDGVPVQESRSYAATPIVIDEDDWRGPLLPGSTRKFTQCCYHGAGLRPAVEVAELRVWNGPRAEEDIEGPAPVAAAEAADS
jgi:hypothetical protein